ncbi:MAG: RtcB family protein [Bacteroidales bacterium]|nr:RtcB family protein [Bacteroidales bacterium]
MKTIRTKYGKEVKIFAKTIEQHALQQITDFSNNEAYKNSTIRIMPDCHAGKGSTVGTTMTVDKKVSPSLVGADIGCGMLTIELAEKNIDLNQIDAIIHRKVPSGRAIHNTQQAEFDFSGLRRKYELDIVRARKAIGSLGGGNHFIEIGKNNKDKYFLVIHSGSRGIGSELAKLYQKTAAENMNSTLEIEKLVEQLKAEGRFTEIQNAIQKEKQKAAKINTDLAYLEGESYDDYLHDMKIILQYASLNRRTIAKIILKNAHLHEKSSFETIHNYIDFDRMILRKGAVRAEKGEKLLIPLNMRDGSLICTGKGNSDWNYSAPHGAGRLMSRTAAKQQIDLNEFKKQMKGIYSTSVGKSTIDEAPHAYKPMDEIMEMIKDTVEIEEIIRPVYNFKAH